MTLYMLWLVVVGLLGAGVMLTGDTVMAIREWNAGVSAASSTSTDQPAPTAAAVRDTGDSAIAIADGAALFQKLGCPLCHRPDGSGPGPVLQGLFGRPLQDASCGSWTIDEAYLREAILTPTATVAVGFNPIMPSFAAQLREAELEALVAYLKSLPAALPSRP